MKLSNMTKNAGMAITKLFAPLKKHAPQILMAGGIDEVVERYEARHDAEA